LKRAAVIEVAPKKSEDTAFINRNICSFLFYKFIIENFISLSFLGDIYVRTSFNIQFLNLQCKI